MYPEIKKVVEPMLNFPTKWQAVIFRNYGFVPTEKIAKVLSTEKSVVETEAKRLGLSSVEYNSEWEKSGYITIIRNNWYLLDLDDICTLLSITREKMEYLLKEEDFLCVKLGRFKPECDKITYSPLSESEIVETEKVCKFMLELGSSEGKPFNFFSNNPLSSKTYSSNGCDKIIYGYLTPCGDVFSMDSNEYLSNELLSQYQQVGVNGIWIHTVLSELSPYPFCERLSAGYEKRREELSNLIKRCERFGIKVYLYFNEPRGLLLSELKNEEIKGHVDGSEVALCLTSQAVRDYLYNAVYDLVSSVSGLGGIITITMSENLTHCWSRGKTNCKNCLNVSPCEYPVLINNIIAKAIKDSGSSAKILANLWAWVEKLGFSMEDKKRAIDMLDESVSIILVSELEMEIEKQGVKTKIPEYSISNVGPSQTSKELLLYAKSKGRKTYAKIQVNNSWEISAVPSLPTYDLVYEHLKNLKDIGVENYMLSWTLGGYPSLSLQMASAFSSGVSLEKWYEDTFGDNAKTVHRAVIALCDAFKEFPYACSPLYYSPKNLGYGNMWGVEYEDRGGFMVGNSFDKYEQWIWPYSYEQYTSAYKSMTEKWKEGLDLLEKIDGDDLLEKVKSYALVAYLHFRADYHQTLYSFYKRQPSKYKSEILAVLSESEKDVYLLIGEVIKDAALGYEASNHYFYNVRNLKEKLLNLQRLKDYFGKL
ncbi:MAG: hypothetical protein IKJ14_01205 [Clostridia bacterium]|nr:hypothetical protein [Clostridia bacterium]